MDQHLDRYGLIDGEQRGAIRNCSGTVDNLSLKGWLVKTVKR